MVLSPREVLITQATVNAEDNTPGVIVREALRIYLAQGALPESDELARQLTDNIGQYSRITTLPSQIFNRLIYGKELAQRRHKVHQATGKILVVPKWHKILKQQVEEGTLSSYTQEVSGTLQGSVESEVDRMDSIKELGFCAAQFHLRPQEPRYASDYFASHGIPLLDGKFSMAEYQLLRGIDAAEATLFANLQYRTAFEQIADALREAGWAAEPGK